MNKGRKTTFEERIEIAQYTIANDVDYQKAIEKYGISYQQVYAWVRKYQTYGQDALKDNPGRKKPMEELNEQERLKLRIKELEARNEIHTNPRSTCRLISSDSRTEQGKKIRNYEIV